MSLQLPSTLLDLTSSLVHHLTTTPVHDTYFPYARFTTLHAIRVSIVWASLTRSRRGKVGYLQDLFGYLVIAWGGSTLSSILLSTPPAWFHPTPWLIYPLIHFLFLYSPVPISRIAITSIPSPIIDLAGAYIDGITRGSTVSLLSSSSLGVIGRALISGVCISGGGWIVQLLNLHGTEWTVQTPVVLKNGAGVLDSLDTWSAFLLSVVYSIITNPSLSTTTAESVISPGLDMFIKGMVPTQLDKAGATTSTSTSITPEMGRAVVIVLMASLLSARVITRLLLPSSTSTSTPSSSIADGIKEIEKESEKGQIGLEEVVGKKSREGTPSKKRGTSTPKKSPRVKL